MKKFSFLFNTKNDLFSLSKKNESHKKITEFNKKGANAIDELIDLIKDSLLGLKPHLFKYLFGYFLVVTIGIYYFSPSTIIWSIFKGLLVTFLSLLFSNMWFRIANKLAIIEEDVKKIKDRNYKLAFANLVQKIDSKAVFNIKRFISPDGQDVGPAKTLNAVDTCSPYDWLTNDVLAYDAIFRTWLRSNSKRELHRILIWSQRDFLSTIGMKVIEIQWYNAYHLYILSSEQVQYFQAIGELVFDHDGIDSDESEIYQGLNYMVWDIDIETPFSSPSPIREKNDPRFGFYGVPKNNQRDENNVELEIEYMAREVRDKYCNKWKALESKAIPLKGLIGSHPCIYSGIESEQKQDDHCRAVTTGEVFEKGFENIVRPQMIKFFRGEIVL